MIVADTSVAVAAALPWHESHAEAAEALPPRTRAIAHVALETFSVLTRLPSPQRIAPPTALEYLLGTFRFPAVGLPEDAHEHLLRAAAGEGIAGGAVYDALVGATARTAGATLLTLDRRAVSTYQLLGVEYRLISLAAP